VNFNAIPASLVAGLALAGLYGLLPIAIVLSYRISRTIAFVHCGIAAAAALVYWLLALNDPLLGTFSKQLVVWADGTGFGARPELNPFLALILTVAFGAILGAAYGSFVMSRRISRLSVLTLTIISLGTMMVLIGIFGYLNVEPDVVPPSPFGNHIYGIFGVNLTANKIATLALVTAISAVLAVWLTRAYTGLCIRALADDIEAGVWCGIKLRRVGTGVYAGSGALAALAGVLIAVAAGPNPDDMVVLFLRGLAVAVVGGMRSLPLAFAAAIMLGIMETALSLGVFGDVGPPLREVILSGMLLTAVIALAVWRREKFFLLERQAL
jgi:branched-subunit amino acid ABC-type transport system permease component